MGIVHRWGWAIILLAGFPVDKPDGQRWGVLVLDSTYPTLNSQRAVTEYRTCHGKVLGRIMGEL